MRLKKEQKKEVCVIASIGCGREIAARYLGCSEAELETAIAKDKKFCDDLKQAEAGAELKHLRNVQRAAEDEQQWRASVWWLERRAPERYGKAISERAVSINRLRKFLESLAAVIAEEVQREEDRQRLLGRLETLAGELGEG